VEQDFRTADGTVAAEVVSVVGMLDLERRRLLTDPREIWRSLATEPELLGI
jgi:acyl-CoA thioester hydrolase